MVRNIDLQLREAASCECWDNSTYRILVYSNDRIEGDTWRMVSTGVATSRQHNTGGGIILLVE